MPGIMTNEEYICVHLGIDGYVDYGELPNQIYRDIVIIDQYRLSIDIHRNLIISSENPSLKRYEIVKKEIEQWKSELPLKSKTVFIDKENERN